MKFWLTAYVLLLSVLLLLAEEWQRLPDDKLHVALLDVGQGDAILIKTPTHQKILVDGGPDLSLLERLSDELPFFDRTIDLLILTHQDSDHITALPALLERYNVERILLAGTLNMNSRYAAFLDAAHRTGSEIIIADANHDLDLGGGVVLDVLWPKESLFQEEVKETNNASIVAKLTYPTSSRPPQADGLRGASILLTGDIEEKTEEALLKAGYDLHSDILKVPHHGSKTSSSTGFLLAVNPDLAVISVGRENTYGHPHPSILERYEALHIPVRRTDREGKVELVLD
ncbi:MAG TPA: ComEC/Rec2 family competence protein [Candidatus Peribacterales bacterium]|nr:ComEC/Rec2 family competence protein [Candidatus Peribacterales bacterium]